MRGDTRVVKSLESSPWCRVREREDEYEDEDNTWLMIMINDFNMNV